MLKEFPQLAERIDNPGGSLSGGEQQMLAIGRALMANPELILMDEPSEGLSPRLVQQVQEIMQRLRSLGQAILLVEQNLQLALSAADDVYVLSAGQFVFQGTPAALANETQVLDQHLGVASIEDGLIHTRRSYGNGNHHISDRSPATVHWGFLDAKIPPRLTIESGDTVTIDTVSGGLGDVGDTSIMLPHHREICETLKPSPGPHILTGPIAVRGAEPGDSLEVRIKAIELTVDWGWNLIRPLRGTLPEDYPEFRCRIIPIDRRRHDGQAALGTDLPLRPFFGIIAVAPPPHYGLCSSVEPREFGGNMDNKELSPAHRVHFPVFVPGANFSAGDGHAVQGDGEVCLTALETCLRARSSLFCIRAWRSTCHALSRRHTDHDGLRCRPRRCRQAGPARDDTLAGLHERLEHGGGLCLLQPRLRSAGDPAGRR